MIIDSINLNHLRIFECVYRKRSMTAAAKELHLTQSGVSQHMKSLEDVLGIRLFDRVKQRLVPTRAAAGLFEETSESLYRVESALSRLKGGEKRLIGNLAVGMPIEFGNNIVLPALAEFGRQHPDLRFLLRYGFATEMNQGILSGELDFAFVDDFAMDPSIETKPVYDEVLQLCATKEYVKSKGPVKKTREYYEALEYADYQPGEPILRRWLEHHLGTRSLALKTRTLVMDVQAVARLVLQGFAAGVLPDYLVTRLRDEGNPLHIFEGSGKPLKNRISVAYLRGRTQSPAAIAGLEFLRARTAKKG